MYKGINHVITILFAISFLASCMTYRSSDLSGSNPEHIAIVENNMKSDFVLTKVDGESRFGRISRMELSPGAHTISVRLDEKRYLSFEKRRTYIFQSGKRYQLKGTIFVYDGDRVKWDFKAIDSSGREAKIESGYRSNEVRAPENDPVLERIMQKRRHQNNKENQ